MDIELEDIPLKGLRPWFPVQDVKRAMVWIVVVTAMTILAAGVLQLTDLALIFLMFSISLYLALQSQRIMGPARLRIKGVTAARLTLLIDEIISTAQPSKFEFTKCPPMWRYTKRSLLYSWDPVICLESNDTEMHLLGPLLFLVQIRRELQKGSSF